jgi:hypothetical protein
MATANFTVRYLNHLKPQPKRYEVFDMLVPGLAIRVTPSGHKSFTLYYRRRISPRAARTRRHSVRSAPFFRPECSMNLVRSRLLRVAHSAPVAGVPTR